MKKYVLIILLLFSLSSFAFDCHPEINSNLPQYIIGYGSLLAKMLIPSLINTSAYSKRSVASPGKKKMIMGYEASSNCVCCDIKIIGPNMKARKIPQQKTEGGRVVRVLN